MARLSDSESSGVVLERGSRELREGSCLSKSGRAGGRRFAGAEGDLLLEFELSANLPITGLTTRLVRVCAAFLGMRGVDERDGFPLSVRPARVPALPDVDAVLGFRLLVGDSWSES